MMKLTNKWIADHLPKRPKNVNKGTFGKVLVIAGSENYPGAAYLCCVACYRVGAGLVTLATTTTTKILVAKKLPEVTFLSYDEVNGKLNEYNVVLLGPGLGQKVETAKLINELIRKKLPKIVIDGDGLNILSKIERWWEMLDREVILTPHPGEMGRLTGLTIGQIQSDRVNIAKEFSKKWKKTVVLKGANTIIASPAGEVRISPFANPVLATAGTGDVLSGMIAGFLAQGVDLFDASCVGVYVHGLAGERLREIIGDGGGLASDLLPILPPVVFNLRIQT